MCEMLSALSATVSVCEVHRYARMGEYFEKSSERAVSSYRVESVLIVTLVPSNGGVRV